MAETFSSRIKSAWNAFFNKDPTINGWNVQIGSSSSYRPDRVRLSRGNERTIVTAVYNRIAADAAAIDIRHVKLDDNGRFLEEVDSEFNKCLSLEANLDQTGRAFIQDAVMSMLDEGCIALLPTDTDDNPEVGIDGSFDILEMRVAQITKWFPSHVQVQAYNEVKGKEEEITISKRAVAIVENPFYAVMNEPNSTLKRLIRKLTLLDVVDEQSGSGKLDLIIQLPYVIKSKARGDQAESRRKDIENQLKNSELGIAYTDGSEHITQLNRPVENNLMSQVEYLTNLLFSQLGITQAIMDGTADEKTMLNYYNRTIEPILATLADEMKRKFLTKTARSQHHSVEFYRDPFKLVPVTELAELSDKMTRNEIMTSNEIRQVMGMKPSKDPNADVLRNKNLSEPSGGNNTPPTNEQSLQESNKEEEIQNE